MKSVSGKIVSSKPISLSKASKIVSEFVSFENGASQPVSVYLRRASAAFTELTRVHKELKRSRSHQKQRFKNYNSLKTEQIPEEIDGVEHFEDGSKSKKNSNKENPERKEGEIDGEKKSEIVERESGSSMGDELQKRKEKKRKGGEIDDEGAFDSGEQKKKKKKKKKKRRRIEGNV